MIKFDELYVLNLSEILSCDLRDEIMSGEIQTPWTFGGEDTLTIVPAGRFYNFFKAQAKNEEKFFRVLFELLDTVQNTYEGKINEEDVRNLEFSICLEK